MLSSWLEVLGFMVMGLVSRLSLANHSDSESLLVVHTLFSQDGCQREDFLGRGRTCGVSFWPFLNSSGWWRLISSLLLTRTSCHKTTHANGYYGAWPGWAVSVSVLPLTYGPFSYRGSMAHVRCPRNVCWSNAVVEQDSSSASWLKSANLFKSWKKYSWTHCCLKLPLYQNDV